jgi:hypothetical protein
MDEKEILNGLTRISENLGKVAENICNENWEGVETYLAEANKIQEKIKKNPVKVGTFMAQNPSFEKEYSVVKSRLLEQLKQNMASINVWKMKHTEKIAGTKNTLDNFSKYYKPQKTSYYIDKKE